MKYLKGKGGRAPALVARTRSHGRNAILLPRAGIAAPADLSSSSFQPSTVVGPRCVHAWEWEWEWEALGSSAGRSQLQAAARRVVPGAGVGPARGCGGSEREGPACALRLPEGGRGAPTPLDDRSAPPRCRPLSRQLGLALRRVPELQRARSARGTSRADRLPPLPRRLRGRLGRAIRSGVVGESLYTKPPGPCAGRFRVSER